MSRIPLYAVKRFFNPYLLAFKHLKEPTTTSDERTLFSVFISMIEITIPLAEANSQCLPFQ